MIVVRTPLRIPLGGGGTDITSYSSRFGGFVMTAAINKYIYVTVKKRELDQKIKVGSECVDQVGKLKNELVREILKFVGIHCGIEISSICNIPSGSGLGGSGAFTVGLLNALYALKSEKCSQSDLAEYASTIEIDILRQPIGKQDQYITALGGIQCLEIMLNGSVTATAPKISPKILSDLLGRLLFFHTQIERKSAAVLVEQYNATKNGNQGVIDSLHQIKEIGYQTKDVLEKGKLSEFGKLLHDHWLCKKALSPKVSSKIIDSWYDLAIESGASGGKIMGAGSGGFFMFYCDKGKEKVRQALLLKGLTELQVNFDFQGTTILTNSYA